MDTISIIVPVYNVANYLPRCIDSVIEQTLFDWELILVNDGSIDASAEICQRYALIDPRIRYYEISHAGQSAARNVGIEKASGDFLVFVDSDDAMLKNGLQILTDAYRESHADFIVADYTKIRPDGMLYSATWQENGFLTDRNGITEILLNFLTSPRSNRVIHGLYGKLYKRSIIFENDIRFDESLIMYEDLEFVVQYMCVCETFHYVPAHVYVYYQNTANVATSRRGAFASIRKPLGTIADHLLAKGVPEVEHLMVNSYIDHGVTEIFYIVRRLNTDLFSGFGKARQHIEQVINTIAVSGEAGKYKSSTNENLSIIPLLIRWRLPTCLVAAFTVQIALKKSAFLRKHMFGERQ